MARGGGDSGPVLAAGCVIVVITSIVLIACSFSRVEETEACLPVVVCEAASFRFSLNHQHEIAFVT